MKKYGKSVRAAAICMAAALMCGCASRAGENIIIEREEKTAGSDETVLRFFGFKADALNLVAIEASLHGFMNENPDITVVYEGMKGTAYWDAFDKRHASGNMDDVMMIDHDHVLSLSAEDKLVDLSDISTIDNYSDMIKSQFIEEEGSVYFLPTCVSAYGMYANLDMLSEHGQQVPGNLEEFMEVCDYFVSKGITPLVLNNYASVKSIIISRGMYDIYRQEDYISLVRRFNSDKASLVDTLRPGLELVSTMIERGYIDCGETLETAATSEDLDIFAAGERPFMITGGWAVPRLKAKEINFSFEVYPLPVMEDGGVLPVDADTCISVNVASSHVEEARLLVEYLTQPEVLWAYCESQSSFSPLNDDKTPSETAIAPCADCLKSGRLVISSDNNLHMPLGSALRECGNAMLGGSEVDEAAELLLELLETVD